MGHPIGTHMGTSTMNPWGGMGRMAWQVKGKLGTEGNSEYVYPKTSYPVQVGKVRNPGRWEGKH